MNRILIIDDDEAIQLLYADELTGEGYDTMTTGDGSRVMSLIASLKPDLVLLDIRLGNTDGMDLLMDIRNSNYDLPVVLCTAYPRLKNDMRTIAADYVIEKRSDLGELKEKVRMALEANAILSHENAA